MRDPSSRGDRSRFQRVPPTAILSTARIRRVSVVKRDFPSDSFDVTQ